MRYLLSKTRFFLTALVVLIALVSLGVSVDASRSRCQKRKHVSARVDALEASIKELGVRINLAERDYKCRVAMCEQIYRNKSEALEKQATRDFGWLTNKINFLGILLGAAALLGIGIPIWGGGKMFKALHDIKKARMGTVLAGKIASKARELVEASRRDQAARDARNWHEMSKNNYYLYVAFSGKVDSTKHLWNKMPNTLSAVFESILEIRRDLMVQALVCMNQAIVYNVEAKAEQAIIRNLRRLSIICTSLTWDGDIVNVANRMNHFTWSYTAEEMRKSLGKTMSPKVDRLLVSYDQLTAMVGKK